MEVKSLLVKFGTDLKAMEAGFKKADGYIQKHAATFKKVGRTMTVAGAVISGAIGMIVKTASDAQETYAKFGTVFKDVSGKAEAAAKDLASSYGLSTLAAKDMMGATGDLLTGLGVLPGVALDLSEKTQQLAVDLASFTNFSGGAKGASEALTKAMLGERESIKSLGIVITEEMVKEKLLAEGKGDLTGLARKQAAAEATLTIAYEQSKNAIGDYERTSGSLANVSRTLMNRFEDLKVELGTKLIPIVTSMAIKIKEVVEKVMAWVKENPKLAGTMVKIVAAVGILSALLGPILMMLPGIAAGLSMVGVGGVAAGTGATAGASGMTALGKAFKAALGPIGLITMAIVAAGAALNAWINARKKAMDADMDAMTMDKTLAEMHELRRKAIENGILTQKEWAAEVNKFGKDYKAFLKAVSTAPEYEALRGELESIRKVQEEVGDTTEDTAEVIALANEKILSLTKTMVDEIKKATTDEYAYSKWALEQKLLDREAAINAEAAAEGAGAEAIKALEEQKNTAIALAREAHYTELASLDEDHKAAEAERQKTAIQKYIDGYKAYYDDLKTKRDEEAAEVKAKNTARLAEQFSLVSSLNQLEMDKFTYANWLLDERYKKEQTTSTNLLLLWEEYQAQKKALADAAREEEAAARKQSLENTLADISMVLNTIGSLFSQHHQNRMTEIDQEETRRIDAINAQYDAQIAALQGIVEAEEAKTKAVLDSINREYDDKRDQILANMEDNEERSLALAALEQEREDRLAQALIDREAAEQAAIDAVVAMEDTKNTALEGLAEDLEIARAKERKKAAKQEKAVALLAAIVNTAAAIAKALPNIPLAIAVGVLGAIQIAIIKATPLPLKEGGIVTRPTQALIGEAGPEAVIPLNKLGGGLMQPAPVYVKMSLYNYGDINNAGDLDEISNRLAERTRRALERGR